MVDILKALEFIDPSSLDYKEWLEIGMGLKSAANDGYLVTWQDWDKWSQRDPARYQKGVCERKWHSFNSTGIQKNTVFYYAMQNGYVPYVKPRSLNWDDIINDGVPPQEEKDFLIYLRALFDEEDLVSIVTHSMQLENGKYSPADKGFFKSAKTLKSEFLKYRGEIQNVIGDYNPDAGVWVRMNPLDGQGVSNSNVTKYRYTLIESDKTDIDTQLETIYKLRLPCAAIVHSGSRSIHAIVKVDADNYDEYKERVSFIHKTLEKQNFPVDKQNKNPARLSRLPGVQRGQEEQSLIDIHTGYNSFSAWKEYVENDFNEIELPEIRTLEDVLNHPLPLAPELIEGVLRQGHKMLLAGSSKAGKSFALIELGLALSEGLFWMGRRCTQCKVLYINLEIDQASFENRVINVLKAMGKEPEMPKDFTMLHLRGMAQPMFKLTKKLLKRFAEDNIGAIILDPVYKVQSGDENAAGDIAAFTNEFDKLATELGVSLIYCHHHSKGNQGGKRAIDRSSGSGVFARDPDAILDMIELDNKTYRGNQKYKHYSAWRIESTLREFEPIKPINVFFKYPIHEVDMYGLLDDAEYKNYYLFEPKKKSLEDEAEEFDLAFESLTDKDFVEENAMAKFYNIKPDTLRKKIGTINGISTKYNYQRRGGKIYRYSK